jgi:signal transduction histidine kinase
MPLPRRRPVPGPIAGDGLRGLVAVTAVVAATLIYNSRGAEHPRSVDAAWLTLLAASGVPAAVSRIVPFGAAAAALAVSLVGIVAGYPMEASLVLALGLVGQAASRADARRVGAFAVLSGCAIAFVALVRADHDRVLATIGGFAVGMIPALIGERVRGMRADARQAREHAREAREHASRVEELRDRDVQRAVVDERLRIARDLHDITGHHLSAIALQAGGASRATADPLAGEVLRRVHDLASSALLQSRHAVGLLREGSEPVALAPLPRLDTVEQLAAHARSAGIEVTLRAEGHRRELPDIVEVCAYRVIQESLTNVVRHAHARSVIVLVSYGAAAVTVGVDDDGIGGPPKAGAGLTGMRERVTLAGGTLTAGPGEHGWSVRATIPAGIAR